MRKKTRRRLNSALQYWSKQRNPKQWLAQNWPKLLLGSQKSHTLVILESPIACAVGLQGLPLVAIACEEQVLFSPIASQTIISRENVDLVDGRSRRLLLGGEPKLGFNCRGNLCKRNTNIDKSTGSRSRSKKKSYLGGLERHSLAGKVPRDDIQSHQRTIPPL